MEHIPHLDHSISYNLQVVSDMNLKYFTGHLHMTLSDRVEHWGDGCCHAWRIVPAVARGSQFTAQVRH